MVSSQIQVDPTLEQLTEWNLTDAQRKEACNCRSCGRYCPCYFPGNKNVRVQPYRPSFCSQPCRCRVEINCRPIRQCPANTLFYNEIFE